MLQRKSSGEKKFVVRELFTFFWGVSRLLDENESCYD